MHNSKYRGRAPLSKEIVNGRLADRGISLVSEYTKAEDSLSFTCSKGHVWQKRVSAVLSSLGCPYCAHRAKRTKEDINESIKDRNIEMIDECKGMQTKSRFKCANNHIWFASPTSIVSGGNGCPSCAKYGFNLQKSAYGYILKFDTFLKYGISNNLKSRLEKHKRTGNFEMVKLIKFDTGKDALLWEQEIKNKYGGNYVDHTVMKDGFTETLSLALMEQLP